MVDIFFGVDPRIINRTKITCDMVFLLLRFVIAAIKRCGLYEEVWLCETHGHNKAEVVYFCPISIA